MVSVSLSITLQFSLQECTCDWGLVVFSRNIIYVFHCVVVDVLITRRPVRHLRLWYSQFIPRVATEVSRTNDNRGTHVTMWRAYLKR